MSLSKTKSLTVPKNNIKCETKLKGTTIEQVPKFNCLGVEISAKRDLKQEVKMQTTKAARVSGCLYNLIWLNKYMSTDCKVRIYKTNVRPVLTYASERRPETTYTQQLLRITEVKVIRAMHGKRLRDKIRSDPLRQLSGIQDIIKWANVRRESGVTMWMEWRKTVSRRLLEIIVHREYAAEADQRNDGKKVLTQLPRPKLWKNRR